MNIYVDATTLIALGEVGDLDLLPLLDGDLRIHRPVADEVTTEPSKSNLQRFCDRHRLSLVSVGGNLLQEAKDAKEEAQRILDEDEGNGDVAIIKSVLLGDYKGLESAVISDDRRPRTVAEGLKARVTGTIGVVVRAVAEGDLTEREAKDLVRRLDGRGLHTTGELREKADGLIEEAAQENGDED